MIGLRLGNGDAEKDLNSGPIVKAELTWFADRLILWYERKRSEMTRCFLPKPWSKW